VRSKSPSPGPALAVAPGVFVLALLAGCATHGPPVDVAASPEPGGVRVQFRRSEPGTAGNPPMLDADGGTFADVVHSPDVLTVSLLWRDGSGDLRCEYPYGGAGRWSFAAPPAARTVRYVAYAADGVRVTFETDAACPVRAEIEIRVALAAGGLPATLRMPDGSSVALADAETRVRLRLKQREPGILAAADHAMVLGTASGERHAILVTIDDDGVPAVPLGFVENW
jgi:hypothetical protein